MNIREFITNALSNAGLGGYARRAEPVVVELEQREEQIALTLAEFAQSKGMGQSEVYEVLANAGLPDLTPKPQDDQPSDGQGSDLAARVRNLEEQVTRLEALARRAGLRA
jgi:hypothetical protein